MARDGCAAATSAAAGVLASFIFRFLRRPLLAEDDPSEARIRVLVRLEREAKDFDSSGPD